MEDNLKSGEQLLEELISLRQQVSQMKNVEASSAGEVKEELRESEELFRELFEHMAAASCIDEIIYENGKPVDYKVIDINPSFERLIGVSRSQAVGALASQLYGIGNQPFFDIYVKVAETGVPVSFEGYFPPIGKHLHVTASCPARGRFSTVFTDITERKSREHEIERLTRLYYTLSQINQSIVRVKSREELFREVCRITADIGGFKAVWVGRRNPETLQVVLVARNGDDEGYLDRISIYADDRPEGQGPVGTCVREDKPCIFNNFLEDPKALPWHKAALAYGIRAVAAFPIHFKGEVWGAFTVYDREVNAFQDKEIELLAEAAMDISFAMENLEKEVQRQAAYAALRESEERFHRAIMDSPFPIILHAEDGMILNVSNSWCEISGYKREELATIGDWTELACRERKTLVQADIDRLFGLDCRVAEGEYIIRTKSGAKRIWECSSAPLGRMSDGRRLVISMAMDITDRKQVEEDLRAERDRFSKIVETSPGAISSFRQRPDGSAVFPYVSPAIWDIYELRPEDLAQDASIMRDLIHPDDIQRVAESIAESARTLYPWREEFRIRHPKKGVVWIESHSMPEREADGGIIWHGILSDITARKRAEEERETLQAQLNQAQKMESIGRLAGGVAHDFNNMLGVILGHAEMAISQVDPTQPLHDDLEEIRKAANRSAALTHQLLAFARKQTVAPKVLDLNETVAGMIKMLQRLIGENLHLSWQPAADLWLVQIDPSQIDQILANLCVNARDAIEGAGRVTIETGNIILDEACRAGRPELVPGEYVLLAVSDDGCGMDMDTLKKLFEPFFTTKDIGKGTGLGLATVYGIVKQNSGFIYAHSEAGKGTTFKIYLPRHAAEAKRIRKQDPETPDVQGHETILLAEDEPAILRMTTTILERQGYNVLAARSPGEAIRLARERVGEIHLLMTDVVMPEMNGRDLARNLMSLYPRLKCLFTSGYTANIIAHHGVLDKGVYFIQKPFSVKDLASKVHEVLDSE